MLAPIMRDSRPRMVRERQLETTQAAATRVLSCTLGRVEELSKIETIFFFSRGVAQSNLSTPGIGKSSGSATTNKTVTSGF